MAIKIAGSALKSRVGQISGNTGICILGLTKCAHDEHKKDLGKQSRPRTQGKCTPPICKHRTVYFM